MAITVGRLAPDKQWDCHLLDLLFENKLYPTGQTFDRVEGYPETDGGILLVPGRYWADKMPEIEDAVAAYRWLLLIVTSDEAGLFRVEDLEEPSNVRFWVQTPNTADQTAVTRYFGCGFPAHFDDLPSEPPDKDIDVFLSAQNNHSRRAACFDKLHELQDVTKDITQTAGFTEGLSRQEYAHLMTRAKVAPAPSGVYSPDSFRVYEALESHAVPIADDVSPVYDSAGYWRKLFPDAPFPILTNANDWLGYAEDTLRRYPSINNEVAAWWMKTKRMYSHWLLEDLEALGAI